MNWILLNQFRGRRKRLPHIPTRMKRLMGDFRFLLRQLLRSPGFFAVAVFTLGLGIAANTTMFSLFYQVLLATLPVASPQQLFVLQSDLPQHMPGSASSDSR